MLAGIKLGQVGDVDQAGRGILRPAMLADVKVTDAQGRVVQRVKNVPLTELKESP